MALFGRNKTEKKEEKVVTPVAAVSLQKDTGGVSHILKNPRITEKATMHQEDGVYTFDVSDDATKRTVALAIASVYNVHPRQVRIVPIPSKQKRSVRTGTRGTTRGGKKAYVYLKKGDTITIT